MGQLILLRHGESTYNRDGRFAGTVDVPLTEKGEEQAREAARKLSDIPVDAIFVSERLRARQTLEIAREIASHWPVERVDDRLNEQHFGDLEGVRKSDVLRQHGSALLEQWRRSWNGSPPRGERFLQVQMRVGAFYTEEIWPLMQQGKRVLLVAHGNSLRALALQLLALQWHEIPTFALGNAEPLLLTYHPEDLAFSVYYGSENHRR